MMRILVLCTHNSARSQMAEGWLRRYATDAGLDAEIWSAGTEATAVKAEAVAAMREVGIDIATHTSKTLWDVPRPWSFDIVLSVCDSANDACPSYPAGTTRLHVSFADPTGQPRETWRRVRDAIGAMSEKLVASLERGRMPTGDELAPGAD